MNNSHEKALATSENNFGEVVRATGPMAKANPFRFSTKYQDDETDLVFFGLRYYLVNAGRWNSRDPIGEQAGENLYGFVANSSVGDLDWLGLCACTCLRIDITPSEKDFKSKIDFYPVPVFDPVTMTWKQEYRLGVPINVRFVVDGAGCTFHVKEEKGGVSGRGPDGKIGPTPGKDTDVEGSGTDATGIVISKPGEWTVIFNLKQTFTCTSTDGVTKPIVEKRHWKAKVTKSWPPK